MTRMPDPDDVIGGVSSLALWADSNPGELFDLLISHGLLSRRDWTRLVSLLPKEVRDELERRSLADGAWLGVPEVIQPVPRLPTAAYLRSGNVIYLPRRRS